MACHRNERKWLRQTHYCGSELLHPIRPGACAFKRHGTTGRGGNWKSRRCGKRIQHHCGGWRYCHGTWRDALLLTKPWFDCRQRGIHGQCPLRRCHGVHFQLWQNHPGNVNGGNAFEYSDHLCFRRSNGSRQNQTFRSTHPLRFSRCDDWSSGSECQ